MFADRNRTPNRGTSSEDNGDNGASPLSFAPLLSQVDTSCDPVSDDVASSFELDHRDDFNDETCTIQVAIDMQHEGPDAAEHDDQSSVHSGKTSKTAATASTSPLSQNQSQSLSSAPDEIQVEEGMDLLGTRQQQPISRGLSRGTSDVEFFNEPIWEPTLILGVDISHLSPRMQFIVCALGVFGFNLLYGYLQELISVQICNRKLGLFLATMQFTGYTVFSFILKSFANRKQQKKGLKEHNNTFGVSQKIGAATLAVPFITYLTLSLIRSVDLAMTNLAMQYINYPAKTLMKSSRVVFTMIFGVLIARKKYKLYDYFVVMCMVAGLAIFMHADATSSAVFQPAGVIMLTISLICDGAVSNMSESIMKNYGVGQDEFIFKMYSIALVAITLAAAAKGDLQEGMLWMMQPGTYDEMKQGVLAREATWSVAGKFFAIILFSSMGLFGSSCSAAITKHFGALTMSITSTARKATTLFLSFFLFNNVCTMEHIGGIIIFIAALTAKSLRRHESQSKNSTNKLQKDGLASEKPNGNWQSPVEVPIGGTVLEMELRHRLEGATFHLTKPMERTPIAPSRAMVKAPKKIPDADVPSARTPTKTVRGLARAQHRFDSAKFS